MKRYSLSMIFKPTAAGLSFLILAASSFLSPAFAPLAAHTAWAESAAIPPLILSLPLNSAVAPSIGWFEKGKALYRLMAYREAAEAFSRIERESEKSGIPKEIIEESLYLRANSLMKTRSYPGASAEISLIPEKSRFYSYALYTKAMIALYQGNEKGAIEIFDQITRDFPAEEIAFKAHLTSGFIFLEKGDPEDAVRHFAVIPATSPFYEQALFGSGWAYARMGRWVRVVVSWEELSSRYPESKYTIEVMPHIGRAYATLSAYGKALEQNGAALQYYENLLKRLSAIEKGVQSKDIKIITQAIDLAGDREMAEDLELYHGLLSLEGYLLERKDLGEGLIVPLINASDKTRDDIENRLVERLSNRIGNLRQQLLEASFKTSLEVARNLRLDGGGRISDDMIFNKP